MTTIDIMGKSIPVPWLGHGPHSNPDHGMCAMEAVAWLAGERHTDRPRCACPVISAFVRDWNDSLPDDETRTRLLRPLLPHLLDTRLGEAAEIERAWMAADWTARVHAPAFLELTAELAPHAETLRALPALTEDTAREAQPAFDAACSAALCAARSATYYAADSAARSAALCAADSAVYYAAQYAAYSAARSAARSAAYSAARSAARSAAYYAALCAADSAVKSAADSAVKSAADSALAPTVERLQASAQELVIAMCAVGRPVAEVRRRREMVCGV